MNTCKICGGLRATKNFEIIAGTPCQCQLIPASGSVKLTQRQLEDILIHEGIIQSDAIERPEEYDGGKTELAVSIATQKINAALSQNVIALAPPTLDSDLPKDVTGG